MRKNKENIESSESQSFFRCLTAVVAIECFFFISAVVRVFFITRNVALLLVFESVFSTFNLYFLNYIIHICINILNRERESLKLFVSNICCLVNFRLIVIVDTLSYLFFDVTSYTNTHETHLVDLDLNRKANI